MTGSVLVDEDAVVVWRHSPVLGGIVLVRIILLVISEKVVQLDALSEVLVGLKASNVLHHVEVAVHVHASADKSVPVNALELDVGVVLLELEVNSLDEVNVRPLDGVHILASHLELGEVVVLWEHFHI